MDLVIQREKETPTATTGRLSHLGVWMAYTLEDPVRAQKVYGDTAIAPGRYRVTLSWSVRFKRVMLEVKNVPNFTGVRLHGGNTTANTKGCPMVGLHRDGETISLCAPALAAIEQLVTKALSNDEEVWLDVHAAEALTA